MNTPLIYAGVHQPSMAGSLPRCMISVNRLMGRRSDFPAQDWILDSGAFSRIVRQQGHLHLREYAAEDIPDAVAQLRDMVENARP